MSISIDEIERELEARRLAGQVHFAIVGGGDGQMMWTADPTDPPKPDPLVELRKLEEIARWDVVYVNLAQTCGRAVFTFSRTEKEDEQSITLLSNAASSVIDMVGLYLSALIFCGREIILNGEPFEPFSLKPITGNTINCWS